MEIHFLDDRIFFPAKLYELFSQKRSTNFVFSPLFIQYFNVLMRLGARGETAEEIKTILRHTDLPDDTVKANVRRSISTIVGLGRCKTVRFINSMFINKGYRVKNEFKKMAEEFFSVKISSLNFNSRQAVDIINQQIKDDTKAQTRNAVNSLDIKPETKSVLTSSAYFHYRWTKPFPTEQIFVSRFYVTEKRPIRTHFLHSVNYYNYYESDMLGVDMVELKLENGGSMVVVRPKAIDGIAKVEEKIVEIFSIPLADFREDLVRVEIPRFQIHSKINYKHALNMIGVTKMFDPLEADLSRIVENPEGFSVDFLYQRVRLHIEDGGISSGERFDSVPGQEDDEFHSQNAFWTFIVDRPFLFYAKFWDHILFGGKVDNPELHYRRDVGEPSGGSTAAAGSSTSYFGQTSKRGKRSI